MFTALKTFLSDLLSTIVFLIVFASTNNAPLAIGISMGVGVLQIVIEKVSHRPVALMQWMSLGLVVVFGTVSIVEHDPRFMMIKPTIIACAVATVMLQKGWLDRYLPEIVHDNVPRSVIIASGYAWAGLIFALGIANLVIAWTCTFKVWAWYSSTVPITAQLTAFGVQYLTFRMIVARKLRGSAPA
jgi:intracellular septation protein